MVRSPEIKAGDLIGFSGQGFVADGINLGSLGIPRYSLSHIAIVGGHVSSPALLLWESTTLGKQPCFISKKRVKGVQAHPLKQIFDRNGKVWHYPLAKRLSLPQQLALDKELARLIGRPYDMIGAYRSGGRIFARIQSRLHGESLDTLFCSEFCHHLLEIIGRVMRGNSSQWSPNSLARSLTKQGIILPRRRLK